jgi:4-amino-4-deoxy-L-arabinose transferase-like glycosyltransferase
LEANDDRLASSRRARPSTHDRSILLVAIAVAAFLRFASISSVPPGLNQDEAVNGYDAFSLSVTGRDHHGHPFPFAGLESFGDWASPLLTFITAPAVGLFGLRVEVIRGVPAALGVLLVLIVNRILKRQH